MNLKYSARRKLLINPCPSILNRYENKGVKWIKDRPSCPGLAIDTSTTESEQSKNAEKNRKKKEAKKRAAEKKACTEELSNGSDTAVEHLNDRLSKIDVAASEEPVNTDEIKKRLKNLRKRLAQIDTLKTKIESGELGSPDPGQLDKIQRRDEVLSEIESLEIKL